MRPSLVIFIAIDTPIHTPVLANKEFKKKLPKDYNPL